MKKTLILISILLLPIALNAAPSEQRMLRLRNVQFQTMLAASVSHAVAYQIGWGLGTGIKIVTTAGAGYLVTKVAAEMGYNARYKHTSKFRHNQNKHNIGMYVPSSHALWVCLP